MAAPQRPLRGAALLLCLSLLAQSRPQASPRPPAPGDPEGGASSAAAAPPGAEHGLAKRAAPSPEHNEVLKELEELGRLRAEARRQRDGDGDKGGLPGGRQLRRQQSLERRLLERRYEELAESRRQAQAARRAAAREERLADLAADLLLRYLLRGPPVPGPGPATAEDKRSEEAEPRGSLEDNDVVPGDDGAAGDDGGDADPADDDLDPGTIDELIELSSKLHLPADDVVDIIRDVEHKRKEEAPPPPVAAPPRHRRPPPVPAVPPVSNRISARTFLPPPRRRPPPPPPLPLRDEELQNYLERVLAAPPRSYP
ncbi:neurosecretory protein VGF [Dromaius novaehollandiae]|uniref:neurosecretory protein VGF n=1 Tax=Dromaius novaehollandiae TaxID=8790 RepID=UPI0031204396